VKVALIGGVGPNPPSGVDARNLTPILDRDPVEYGESSFITSQDECLQRIKIRLLTTE
jgi:hypothetical protein